MEIAALIVSGLALAGVLAIGWLTWRQPEENEKRLRDVLVQFKIWADRDDRHNRRLTEVAEKFGDVAGLDADSLDHLRLARMRLKVELDRIEHMNQFLAIEDSDAENVKRRQIEEIEARIDEHPDREKELEETRSRLVARMEDVEKFDAESSTGD